MSGATFAILVGGGVTLATYLGKRLIDYAFPPNRRWTLFDRWSTPTDTEETSDDVD